MYEVGYIDFLIVIISLKSCNYKIDFLFIPKVIQKAESKFLSSCNFLFQLLLLIPSAIALWLENMVCTVSALRSHILRGILCGLRYDRF